MEVLKLEKIRVLHCVGYMRRAGIETFLMNVYRNIDRSQVQFDFLCSEHKVGDYDKEISDLGGKIYYLSNAPFHFNKGPVKYLAKILQYRDTLRMLRSHVDIVHIHTYHAFDASLMVVGCKLAGIKRVFVHSHNTRAPHPLLNNLFSIYLRHTKIRRLACGIEAGKWLYGSDKCFEIVYNGIDVDKFRFDTQKRKKGRESLGISSEVKVLLHVGRFETQKNHLFLIKAFNEYYKKDDTANLLLAGEGELRSVIQNEVDKLPCSNNIKFLGLRSDIDVLTSVSDMFIMPSLYEGFPVTAIEAESSGLPCLFSDVITKEVSVLNEVRFESLNSDFNIWAEDISNVLSLPLERNKASQVIKEKGFDIKDVANKLSNIYLKEEI